MLASATHSSFVSLCCSVVNALAVTFPSTLCKYSENWTNDYLLCSSNPNKCAKLDCADCIANCEMLTNQLISQAEEEDLNGENMSYTKWVKNEFGRTEKITASASISDVLQVS